MALEPSLWGTLPKELLHLVFAHLPVPKIGQLRALSKEWKRNVDCKDSEFNQVFDATAHLNMFALLPVREFGAISFTGNIYDLQASKWHVPKIDVVFEGIPTFYGADGGLVCFSSSSVWYMQNLEIFIVMNPLTKQKTELPPLPSMGARKKNTRLWIIKLSMDRKTKEYKVFVVDSDINHGLELGRQCFNFAQVYDSRIKEWTIVEATQGHIIGYDYNNVYSDFSNFRILNVYNYADGRLQSFYSTDIAPGLKIEKGCSELIEDHLFVLHKEASLSPTNVLEDGASMLQKCYISEFHLPKNSTAWVKLGMRSCIPCKCFCDTPYNILNLRLWGCNGFLLVHGACSKCTWLYNLSSYEWHTLPALVMPSYINTMCEISWNAIA